MDSIAFQLVFFQHFLLQFFFCSIAKRHYVVHKSDGPFILNRSIDGCYGYFTIQFTSKKINSQIQYPQYRINRSYDQATHFLGNDFLGLILIYDQENHFLGYVFTRGKQFSFYTGISLVNMGKTSHCQGCTP